ncbi:hypothetical protein [Cryobacterium cryoconiti]|uniref:Uncharacterized protein n=1 Tax=Cryobacterium cryoconiti TaxID=1259239 RepID=A0A4Y8JZC8_9MICO|nr:hypothetical protein [Cryobacterium cryoconiti]TFD32709.1 hypothetical protein E3T49_04305 [Cryobacterium cryoconiti]
MFTVTRTLLTVALSASLLVSLAACSAPTTAAPAAEKPSAATATPTPTVAPAGVDALPLLAGLTATAPAGWEPGSCAALNFAGPAGWERVDQPDARILFQNNAEPSLTHTVDGQEEYLVQSVMFSCGLPKTEWDGEWSSGEGTESYRLDVAGATYSAVIVWPVVNYQAEGYGDIPGDFFKAEIQIVTPEQDYFTALFTLPANDNAYNVVAQVASGLSVG